MRPTNFIGLASCVLALLFAYFLLEVYMFLEPCPLCILDRIVVGLMGLVFFVGLFTTRKWIRHALTGTNLVLLGFGFLFAGRHVWIQNRPVDVSSECLSEQPQIKGITDLIAKSFDADADCALIGWQLFGLSIPGLLLVFFFFLLALLVIQAVGTMQDSDEYSDD